MDNRKKKRNKHKNKQKTYAQKINVQKENTQQNNKRSEDTQRENISKENIQKESISKDNIPKESISKESISKEDISKVDIQSENKPNEVKENVQIDKNTVEVKETVNLAVNTNSNSVKKDNEKISAKTTSADSKVKTDIKAAQKADSKAQTEPKREQRPRKAVRKDMNEFSPENVKEIAIKAAKILLPAAACVIIIAVIISYMGSQKTKAVENQISETETDGGVAALSNEPLQENAYSSVNELMSTFYTALADGDMDTVKSLKDYNSDKEIITYEKKSEFIEYYDSINCYTKPGISENTYFVYVTYTVKIQDIETKAPGLNAWYVYTAEDGNLKIDGDTEENIKASFKLVTSQDDVVDLYNKIDVSYKEAVASDESLSAFMDELPVYIKTSVGEALAELETQTESPDGTSQTEVQASGEEQQTQPAESEQTSENEELPQNQVVNQIVRTTDTVNVRSSDSEEADRIGKAQAGTELTRTEDRVNGWSKVIFEGKEAYIKSDYLEVITTEAVSEPIGSITALTNVNVRSQASQESAKLGTAQAGNSYELLEDLGEWFKINYNGNTGFVKAEFFER